MGQLGSGSYLSQKFTCLLFALAHAHAPPPPPPSFYFTLIQFIYLKNYFFSLLFGPKLSHQFKHSPLSKLNVHQPTTNRPAIDSVFFIRVRPEWIINSFLTLSVKVKSSIFFACLYEIRSNSRPTLTLPSS